MDAEIELFLGQDAEAANKRNGYRSRSFQEVSNALKTIVQQAEAFLDRPLMGRRFKYLYVDDTNFRVRRTTVEREPTLVVIG